MVLDHFKEINEVMQQTNLMVSHEDRHKNYFHRIIRLQDGKVISDGTTGTKHRYADVRSCTYFLDPGS